MYCVDFHFNDNILCIHSGEWEREMVKKNRARKRLYIHSDRDGSGCVAVAVAVVSSVIDKSTEFCMLLVARFNRNTRGIQEMVFLQRRNGILIAWIAHYVYVRVNVDSCVSVRVFDIYAFVHINATDRFIR